jgi:hypothetical protein
VPASVPQIDLTVAGTESSNPASSWGESRANSALQRGKIEFEISFRPILVVTALIRIGLWRGGAG